jgi:hypothetical protein
VYQVRKIEKPNWCTLLGVSNFNLELDEWFALNVEPMNEALDEQGPYIIPDPPMPMPGVEISDYIQQVSDWTIKLKEALENKQSHRS